ncbi:MAG: hypothetical protein Q8P67_06455 [archaeon]|nr:hypothetical protein [archaeon]
MDRSSWLRHAIKWACRDPCLEPALSSSVRHTCVLCRGAVSVAKSISRSPPSSRSHLLLGRSSSSELLAYGMSESSQRTISAA